MVGWLTRESVIFLAAAVPSILILADLLRFWWLPTAPARLESSMITILGLLLYQGLGANLFLFLQYARKVFLMWIVLVPFFGLFVYVLIRTGGRQWMIYPIFAAIFVAVTARPPEGTLAMLLPAAGKMLLFWGTFAFALSMTYVPMGQLAPDILGRAFPPGSMFRPYIRDLNKIVFMLVVIQVIEITYHVARLDRFGKWEFFSQHWRTLGAGIGIGIAILIVLRISVGLAGRWEFFSAICPTENRPVIDVAEEPEAARFLFNLHALRSLRVPSGERSLERFARSWKEFPEAVGTDPCPLFAKIPTSLFQSLRNETEEAIADAQRARDENDFRAAVDLFERRETKPDWYALARKSMSGVGALTDPMSTNRILTLAILRVYDDETRERSAELARRMAGGTNPALD